jgi:hypothetical protein
VATIVQITKFDSGYSGSFDAPVTAGNTIVLAASGHTGDPANMTNPLYDGSPVTGASEIVVRGSNDTTSVSAEGSIWILPDVATSGTSISITVDTDAGPYVGVIAFEIEGLGTAPLVIQSNSTNSTATSNTSAQAISLSSSSSGAGEFVLALVVQDGTAGSGYPVGAPWTTDSLTTVNTYFGYLITGAAGQTLSYDSSTGDANWVAMMVEIAANSSSGATGTGAASMQKMVAAGTGNAPVIGTGSAILTKMTGAGSGNIKVPGTGTATLPKMTVAGTANAAIVGTGSATLPKMTMTGGVSASIFGHLTISSNQTTSLTTTNNLTTVLTVNGGT